VRRLQDSTQAGKLRKHGSRQCPWKKTQRRCYWDFLIMCINEAMLYGFPENTPAFFYSRPGLTAG
jgi:hypothetical protein